MPCGRYVVGSAFNPLAAQGDLYWTCRLKTPIPHTHSQLPPELIEHVLRYAGPLDTARLASVDRRWHHAASSTSLWRDFFASAPFADKLHPLPKAPPAGSSWQAWYGAHHTVTHHMPKQLQMHRVRLDALEPPPILESTSLLALQTFWTALLIPIPVVAGTLAGAVFLAVGAGMLVAGCCVALACASGLVVSIPVCVALWALSSSRLWGVPRLYLPHLLNAVAMMMIGACFSLLSFLTVQYFAFCTALLATMSAVFGTATLLNAVAHFFADPTALGHWLKHRPVAAQHRQAYQALEKAYHQQAQSLARSQQQWTS